MALSCLRFADGRVSDLTKLRDGLPDNVGATERNSCVVTVDSAVGNYLVLDLDGGDWRLVRICSRIA
jgi:hypothetical protein